MYMKCAHGAMRRIPMLEKKVHGCRKSYAPVSLPWQQVRSLAARPACADMYSFYTFISGHIKSDIGAAVPVGTATRFWCANVARKGPTAFAQASRSAMTSDLDAVFNQLMTSLDVNE